MFKKKAKIKGTPVFDEEMLTGHKAEDGTITPVAVDKGKQDKIFFNDFNTGNIDVEALPTIKIDGTFAKSNLEDCYNADEYAERKDLMDKVYAAFEDSQWKNLPLTKKFSKELMPFIFNDLFKAIDGQGHTTIDMFIAIAEFMDISYERIYEIAGLKMKERLIHELENKYKILSKKNIKRLF
jgi:galactokinase